MSDKYKIWDPAKAYFLTITVVGWIDVFIRKNYKLTLINSLQYCQREKALVIFGYCIMPSHLHLIARAEGKDSLSDILRDFKKFTSKAIVQQVLNEDESRKDWMLEYFRKAGENLKGITNYKFWQDLFSSARNYAGLDNYLEIVLESVKQRGYR